MSDLFREAFESRGIPTGRIIQTNKERAGKILDAIHCPDYGTHRETEGNEELWKVIETALDEAGSRAEVYRKLLFEEKRQNDLSEFSYFGMTDEEIYQEIDIDFEKLKKSADLSGGGG